MSLESLIASAVEQGASDLHLEPSLPPAFRVRGQLQMSGKPSDAKQLLQQARDWIGENQWNEFLERGSFDLSRTVQGHRCRINVLKTTRGVGFAIRLLSRNETTLRRLNLHPELRSLIEQPHGLVVISGPTGSGKSSTLAALIQEINTSQSKHIVTIESPIEYRFRPRQSYIRQREVGRDTPTVQQALVDALREDPDVIMVGESREPETMRLTLNAAETGHLVLVTVHSSNTVEALQRIVTAFPAEAQNGIRTQLADCLIGVVAQRLRYRQDINLRVPECEILRANNPAKAHIRQGDLFRLNSVLETGADHGMWTFDRYHRWLEKQTEFFRPEEAPPANEEEREITDNLIDSEPPLELRPERTTSPLAQPPPQTKRLSTASRPGKSTIEIEPGVSELGRILRPRGESDAE